MSQGRLVNLGPGFCKKRVGCSVSTLKLPNSVL